MPKPERTVPILTSRATRRRPIRHSTSHHGRRVALALSGLLLSAAASVTVAEEGPWFEDRSSALGVEFLHFNGMSGRLYHVEVVGPGGALFDSDADGDLDLYLVQGAMLGGDLDYEDAFFPWTGERPPRDRLFRNDLKGTDLRFTDVTRESGIVATEYGLGASAADVDNDGDIDLYLLNWGRNQLWLNQGNGTFLEAENAGVDDPAMSVSASFTDYDLDGDLDLYVVNYVDFSYLDHRTCVTARGEDDYCLPSAFRPLADRLYRNRGDGTFEDATKVAGLDAAPANGLGVVSHDFDGDGRPDFYVANDLMPNQLWLNQGSGRFIDEGLLSGSALNSLGRAEASMGVVLGDVDGDLDLDLFMTHFTRESNTLMRAGRGAIFDDATDQFDLASVSWDFTSFGTGFLDFDNDGWLDLVIVSGGVTYPPGVDRSTNPFPLGQTNQLLRNREGRGYDDVTPRAGDAFSRSEISRGAILGDLDNDGDTDVVVTNNSGPARVLINPRTPKRWLGARLVLAQTPGSPPRDALGAIATLRRGTTTWLRRHHADGGYACSNDPRVSFGLGSGEVETPASVTSSESSLEVRWPDGSRETFEDLELGRYHTLTQGTGKTARSPGSAEP